MTVYIRVSTLLAACAGAAASSAAFSTDMQASMLPLRFPMLQCVGSSHAAMGLRQDWRQHLAQAHSDIGFTHIRFHGLLDDDVSSYLNGGANMFNIFSVFDFLRSIDMRPIVELSFMPESLASNASETVFHYKGGTSPPSSYAQWAGFITSVVTQLVQRYGLQEVRQWRFEVWNEPNCGFWSGSQAEYFTLYNWTARAVKDVDTLIPVGGPATCQTAWIPDFLNFTSTVGAPVDFVSTHLYPTDPGVPITRDGFMQTIANASAAAAAGGKPLVMTEFNSGLGINQADRPYSSAFVLHNHFAAQNASMVNMDTLSFWTFSDIFEEGGFDSTPYASKFGIQTIYGVPKPVYRGFQFISNMYSSAAPTTSAAMPAASLPYATDGNVDVCVTTQQVGKQMYVYALITNFNVNGNAIDNATVTLTFANVSSASVPATAVLDLVDDNNAFAMPVWQAAGSPMYPTAAEVSAEMVASALPGLGIPITQTGANTYAITLTLLPYASARVQFAYVL